eukprot:scaffold18648_cov124-Isochrysis_galbana.AAC.13
MGRGSRGRWVCLEAVDGKFNATTSGVGRLVVFVLADSGLVINFDALDAAGLLFTFAVRDELW